MRRIMPIYQDGQIIYFKWTPDGAVFAINMFRVDRIEVAQPLFRAAYNKYYISDNTFMSPKVKMIVDNERNLYDYLSSM